MKIIEKNNMIALITSLLFAVHPLHTEAVANIKGRDEIMALIETMFVDLFRDVGISMPEQRVDAYRFQGTRFDCGDRGFAHGVAIEQKGRQSELLEVMAGAVRHSHAVTVHLQLRELIAHLDTTGLHFVRCIKPNAQLAPSE